VGGRAAEQTVVAAGASALAIAAVAGAALSSDILPSSSAALAIPSACAGAIGAVVAVAVVSGWPRWHRRELAQTLLVALLSGAVASAWFMLRPAVAPFTESGVVTVGDAAFLLPGLLAWNAARRPGAVALGLGVSSVVVYLTAQAPFPALAFLAIPVVAAPAELWFLARGPTRARDGGLVGAGILLGVASAAAATLLSPGAALDWRAVIVQRTLAGVVAGFVAARLSSRSVSRPWAFGSRAWRMSQHS
jgi:hypothetical protein